MTPALLFVGSSQTVDHTQPATTAQPVSSHEVSMQGPPLVHSKGAQPGTTLHRLHNSTLQHASAPQSEEDSEPEYETSSSEAVDDFAEMAGTGGGLFAGAPKGPALFREMGSGDGENMSLGRGPGLAPPHAPYTATPSSSEGDSEDMAGMTFCRNCTQLMHDGCCTSCGHLERLDDVLFRPPADQVLMGAAAWAAAAKEPGGMAATSGVAGGIGRPHIVPPVALLWDERMEAHEEEEQTAPHPERPDRIRAIMGRLVAAGLTDACVRVSCCPATVEQLAEVHSPDLVEFVHAMAEGRQAPEDNGVLPLTSDTYVNHATFVAARLAAGGAAQVACMVVRGEVAHGAAIVRPPGHHAESNVAMGFCFFNNAAVAARAAQAVGAQRVLILDWDVHHGNGTQHIFENDPSVLYMSIHRYDSGRFYPGTGGVAEVGEGAGEGYTVNIPWEGGGLGNADYLAAFNHVLIPIAYEYNPDLIIISAGFDAADGDPIGGCRVTPEAFAAMTALLKPIAPCLLLLEGGYNLSSTAQSTEACLRVLLGEQPPPLPGPRQPSLRGIGGVLGALRVQTRHWPCVRGLLPLVQQQQQRLVAVQHAAMMQAAAHSSVPGALRPSIAAPLHRSAVGQGAVPQATPMVGLARGVPPSVAAANGHPQSPVPVPPAPPRPAAGPGQGQQGRSAPPLRVRALASRKWVLLQQIRRAAVKAWWRRHRLVVKSRQAAAASVAPAPGRRA